MVYNIFIIPPIPQGVANQFEMWLDESLFVLALVKRDDSSQAGPMFLKHLNKYPANS